MSFVSAYNTVTVTTNATKILSSNAERKGCLIANTSNQTVFLGMDSSVTTSNGLPVPANGTFNNAGLEAAWRGDVWGIVSGTTADCRFWEFGP